MTREGFIFVDVEGQEEDIFVKANKTRGALEGDKVRVAITREAGNGHREEGEVLQILERSGKPFVGVLHIVGQQAWVLMQSKSMPYDISIKIQKEDAQDGSLIPLEGEGEFEGGWGPRDGGREEPQPQGAHRDEGRCRRR